MAYTYTGDAVAGLATSYAEDDKPYPTDETLSFPVDSALRPELTLLRKLLFPRCWNATEFLTDETALNDALDRLGELVHSGLAPYLETTPTPLVDAVLDRLPSIRAVLKTDIEAAYKGDPAAKSYREIIRSYPGLLAVMTYRFAHELYDRGAPGYARELTEAAKADTGIDIHPGATIGEYFFIDHGSGVVIGETATVGQWVRLYQGVTLGTLHFKQHDQADNLLEKGYKRHPDVGDHVVIGAGAQILGPITVGDHVSIGANSWVTDDVPPETTVYVTDQPGQARKPKQ